MSALDKCRQGIHVCSAERKLESHLTCQRPRLRTFLEVANELDDVVVEVLSSESSDQGWQQGEQIVGYEDSSDDVARFTNIRDDGPEDNGLQSRYVNPMGPSADWSLWERQLPLLNGCPVEPRTNLVAG